jgi:hypothetical protein
LATRLNTKVVLCHMVSVNDVVCHGFPDKEPLELWPIHNIFWVVIMSYRHGTALEDVYFVSPYKIIIINYTWV